MKAVGVPFVKKDAKALVTGKPVYTNDLAPKDCLIVKLLRSPHANAMIQEIKTTTMIATIMSVIKLPSFLMISRRIENDECGTPHPPFCCIPNTMAEYSIDRALGMNYSMFRSALT